jgi:hypothetical protein
MIIRSYAIERADLFNALSDVPGVHLELEREFRPQKFTYGYRVHLESDHGRYARNGRDGRAATWDEHGLWMAELYKLDPMAQIAWYKNAAQFLYWTKRHVESVALHHKVGSVYSNEHQAPWLSDAELVQAAYDVGDSILDEVAA